MKNEKNTITWMEGKNICEFDTETWYTKVHPKPTEPFRYSTKNQNFDNSYLFQYSGNRATDCSSFICKDIIMKGSITNPQPLFDKKGNYTITLLQKNIIEYSDTLINALQIESQTKMIAPSMLSNQTYHLNDSEKERCSDLKSIHEEFYNSWVDRIFEFFELDDSWEGTFRGQPEIKKDYFYMIDF